MNNRGQAAKYVSQRGVACIAPSGTACIAPIGWHAQDAELLTSGESSSWRGLCVHHEAHTAGRW